MLAHRVQLALTWSALLAVAGCGSETPSSPPVEKVASLSVTSSVQSFAALGATTDLTATPRDAEGDVVNNVEIEWSTSNAAVATVTPTGRATTSGNGTAIITARAGNITGSVELTVQQVVTAVVVTPGTWSPTALKATQQFTALPRDANGHTVVGAPVSWYVSDDSTVTLTANGLATAELVGATSLGAVSGADTGHVTVQVTQTLATVEVSPTSWNPTALGTEQQLTSVGKDANGHPLTDWTMVWASSDTTIVTVSPSGLLRAVRQGSASVAGQTALGAKQVPVLVAQTIAALTLAPERDTLNTLGDTLQLVAQATDANGAQIAPLTVTWQSSAPGIATVSTDGLVTAVTPGVATLTVSALGKTAEALITVRNAPPPAVAAIRVSPEDWTATTIGERQQFQVFATDAGGADINAPDFTWQSSDPTIATVGADGIVTAIKAGNVTIRATTGALVSTSSVIVDPGGAIADGVVWTMYYPRLWESPALLTGGVLRTPGSPHGNVWGASGVAKFQWEAERMAILSDMNAGQGTLRVRDRVGEWEVLAVATVADFQLEGNLIGVRHGDGSVQVRAGISGGWVTVANGGVKEFQLEGNRTALLEDDGALRVRDGLGGAWTTVASNVRSFQLEGNRIGVSQTNNDFRIKDGIAGAMTLLGDGNVSKFHLDGNRILVLKTDGELRAKDGISGGWFVLASGGFTKIQADGNRIGAMRANGSFYVKDGMQGAWSTISSSTATDFHLHQGRIGVVANGTRVLIKTGGASAPWGIDTTMASPITQFHAAVAVPMTPTRTTRESYQTLHAACLPVDCVRNAYIPFEWLTIPVPFYGRNCGHGRPTGSSLSIDGMDQICYHHDRQSSWYGSSTGSLSNDLGGACIVRYGLLNARLTRDGQVLTPGSQAYNAAWGLFPETAEAVRRYLNWTSSCTSGYMSDFVQDTRLGL